MALLARCKMDGDRIALRRFPVALWLTPVGLTLCRVLPQTRQRVLRRHTRSGPGCAALLGYHPSRESPDLTGCGKTRLGAERTQFRRGIDGRVKPGHDVTY